MPGLQRVIVGVDYRFATRRQLASFTLCVAVAAAAQGKHASAKQTFVLLQTAHPAVKGAVDTSNGCAPAEIKTRSRKTSHKAPYTCFCNAKPTCICGVMTVKLMQDADSRTQAWVADMLHGVLCAAVCTVLYQPSLGKVHKAWQLSAVQCQQSGAVLTYAYTG